MTLERFPIGAMGSMAAIDMQHDIRDGFVTLAFQVPLAEPFISVMRVSTYKSTKQTASQHPTKYNHQLLLSGYR